MSEPVMWTTIKGKEGLVPLYTEPQQRKPLTDEEIKHLARQTADLPWNVVNQILESNFVRAIERAHGIGEKT
jgi:hypothetical protein